MLFSKLVFAYSSIFAFVFTAYLVSGATLLPDNEVEALREVGKTLGKSNWNYSVDPCSGESGWSTPDAANGFQNAVTCNCSFSDAPICHVVSIVLKAQSLQGRLPPQLIRFPYLQEIDLTYNYLNGTLPPEWGSMNLLHISIYGNRISGSIPKEFGNISTLSSLILEYNQLSGSLPPELGDLPRIERLDVTSNNLSGELPTSLARLTTLKELRLSDNNFTGKIPNFIQSLINLELLAIQASGLDGPIPSSIAALVNLTDLRISDLNGIAQPFPPLNNMSKMQYLVLRSCNISDKLPDYLVEMSGNLKVLDLSFNSLSGEIPNSYAGSEKVNYIYLTGNQLTGSVPDWMQTKADYLDLSYNNITVGSSRNCQDGNMNLFGNYFKGNNSSVVQCLRQSSCQKTWYSLRINCGGGEVNVGGNATYEEDTDSAGPSRFFQKSDTNWAFSNTGHFMNDARPYKSYIWKNASNLSMENSELYMNARLSPISLSYYAFCMGNGNYKIKLHFAEIMFTDDKTYSSLGRRLFDVYIQGKMVQKDFNIAGEAGGVGKAIVKNFTAAVTSNTLEIRFYWAGKGTNAIPAMGVYGPLVSAISVDPDFVPPMENGSTTSSSVGKIVGIVAAITSVIFLVLGILWWKCCMKTRNTTPQDGLEGLDRKTGIFTLSQIKAATDNFSATNKIGEGGFGPVYKGVLSDGTVIAVKQLSSKSKQGNREFVNEIGMISALQHPNLVKLHGCCVEGNQLLLVYEYMENNSLANALFGPEEQKLKLDWSTRQMICVGIARGLAYLHEESRLKIVHRDIKATNVLLDKNLKPKISDFGLAKLDDEDNTHISTRIAGTFGYMAPEYAMHGHLTDKVDVYSFGMVTLEIVSGRSNRRRESEGESFNLLDWALVLMERGTPMELVDPSLSSNLKKKEAMTMINVALLCANASPAARPAMSSVVSVLEGKTSVDELMISSSVKNMKFKQVMKQHDHEGTEDEISTESLLFSSVTKDRPIPASSTSAKDLCSVHLDSDYLENRASSKNCLNK